MKKQLLYYTKARNSGVTQSVAFLIPNLLKGGTAHKTASGPMKEDGNMRDVTKQEMERALVEIDTMIFCSPYHWMTGLERVAYHLGIISDEHIVVHEPCEGRGWIVTGANYIEGHGCDCPRYQGQVITLEGRLLIKSAFPTYEIGGGTVDGTPLAEGA